MQVTERTGMFCSRSGAVTLREGSLEACSKPCVRQAGYSVPVPSAAKGVM